LAVRIRSRFHRRRGQRTVFEMATVIAALGWRLSENAIRTMRKAKFDIDIGPPYFRFICEYLVFVVHVADRVAFRLLDAGRRVEFTTALARRLAEIAEDNREALLVEPPPGKCQRDFIDLVNERGDDYARFGYDKNEGPDFAFRRYFASRLLPILPEKDHPWIMDQAMEIEAPEAVSAIERTLQGLLAPPDKEAPSMPITRTGD
jgi:hypothetical protein